MMIFGGCLLLIGLFVGRPYCRYLCPYGAILRVLSPFSRWHVRIPPEDCINCRLCEDVCPYDAIRPPTIPQSADERRAGRRRFLWLLWLAPVLVLVFAGLGTLLAVPLARWHPEVRLAEQLRQEELGTDRATTDASDAYRSSGRPLRKRIVPRSTWRQTLSEAGDLAGGLGRTGSGWQADTTVGASPPNGLSARSLGMCLLRSMFLVLSGRASASGADQRDSSGLDGDDALKVECSYNSIVRAALVAAVFSAVVCLLLCWTSLVELPSCRSIRPNTFSCAAQLEAEDGEARGNNCGSWTPGCVRSISVKGVLHVAEPICWSVVWRSTLLLGHWAATVRRRLPAVPASRHCPSRRRTQRAAGPSGPSAVLGRCCCWAWPWRPGCFPVRCPREWIDPVELADGSDQPPDVNRQTTCPRTAQTPEELPATAEQLAANWPCFRGPGGAG